jgi:hypothetical protein
MYLSRENPCKKYPCTHLSGVCTALHTTYSATGGVECLAPRPQQPLQALKFLHRTRKEGDVKTSILYGSLSVENGVEYPAGQGARRTKL